MGDFLPLFLVLITAVAIILRADFLLTVVYLFIGAFFLGRWWSARSMGQVQVQRAFPERLFAGERATVELNIRNAGVLPVVWLELHESMPVGLSMRQRLSQVISLGSRETRTIRYELEGRKRGRYQVGPLLMYSGDLLGLSSELRRSTAAQPLIVYPRIIQLSSVRLSSGSPLGSLRHTFPIYEDPSRVRGKRDYASGDSLRRVDWKASAALGRLQVKLFEPSIALETMICLNLNQSEYPQRSWIDSTELGIVVAASLATWLNAKKQSVGLATNGLGLPPTETAADAVNLQPIQILPPRRGRGHLMRLLEVLAQVQTCTDMPFSQLLRQESASLSWGSTLILITGRIEDELFDLLFGLRRAGLHALLVPCGPVSGLDQAREKAEKFGISMVPIMREKDLDIWRR